MEQFFQDATSTIMILSHQKILGFTERNQTATTQLNISGQVLIIEKKTINFDVYVNYATKNDTLNFKNEGTKDVLEGMNVILVPDLTTEEAKSNITELVKDAANINEICFFKAFGQKPKVEKTDTTNTEKDINISSTLWTLIYNFNRFDKYTEKQFDQFTASLTVVDESTNLNLKRVLYTIIGEKLFAEN